MQLSENQITKIKAFRERYVNLQTQIDEWKDDTKALFEDLFENELKFDSKIDKEKIRDIKRGFKLYYKANAPEEQASVNDAVIVAEL